MSDRGRTIGCTALRLALWLPSVPRFLLQSVIAVRCPDHYPEFAHGSRNFSSPLFVETSAFLFTLRCEQLSQMPPRSCFRHSTLFIIKKICSLLSSLSRNSFFPSVLGCPARPVRDSSNDVQLHPTVLGPFRNVGNVGPHTYEGNSHLGASVNTRDGGAHLVHLPLIRLAPGQVPDGSISHNRGFALEFLASRRG